MSAKAHLIERAGLNCRHAEVADALVRYSEAQGAYDVWQDIKANLPSPPNRIATYLLMLAVASPDDTWSGRTNDSRRAYADGKRSAVGDARALLRLT